MSMDGMDGIQIYHGGSAARAWLERYQGKAWQLAIALGFTDTALIPGISAAGKTPGDRRFTALADAEFLYQGLTRAPSRPLPPLMAGLSPVLISRALLELTGASAQLINTGLADAMTVPALELEQCSAKCLSTGSAMARSQVEALFELGGKWGASWPESGAVQQFVGNSSPADSSFPVSSPAPGFKAAASEHNAGPNYAVLGECVVGGTSTALAVLVALGLPALQRVNSSHSHCNHLQKASLVALGLAHSGLAKPPPELVPWLEAELHPMAAAQQNNDLAQNDLIQNRPEPMGEAETWQRLADWLDPQAWRSRQLDPLDIMAAVGDPMQPFLAGCLLNLSCRQGVLLAGGTQMLAVYALAAACAHHRCMAWHPEQVAIGTTAWVAQDPTGDTVGLAQAIGEFMAELHHHGELHQEDRFLHGHGANGPRVTAPILLGSQLNFSQSRHPGLRAYESGFVKEGVAAGGCAIATSLALGWDGPKLAQAIDSFVDLYGSWRRSQQFSRHN